MRTLKEFVAKLDPRYVLPSRRKLVRSLLPALYEKHVQLVKDELKKTNYVGLTSDLWTSRQTKGFLTVTANFIDTEWERRSVVLQTVRMMKDHTAENLANEMREICSEWEISNKVCCVVTDNAPDIVSVVKGMKLRHLGCFAHMINLIVHTAIKNTKQVKEVQERIKAVVSYFHHSVKGSDKLSEIQAERNAERKN